MFWPRQLAGAVALLAVVTLMAAPSLAQPATPGANSAAVHAGLGFTNVSYRSSVDRFPLSYDEWLPAGYTANRSWPLVVFLHGIGNNTTAVRGGVSDFVATLRTPGFEGATERALVQNASLAGFIFISLNTRSSAGFFANTPCGGPQLQDVLDAITHERALRNVSAIDLIGFSMGAIGALEIAGHFPGMIRSVALAAPATDLYEEYDYLNSSRGTGFAGGIADEMAQDNCGSVPGARNLTVDNAFFTYLSVARFAPQNFSHVSIWVSSGGLDTSIPNDLHFFPYLQVNASFVASSCRVVASLGEPSNCTTTWPQLHRAHPSAFFFRDVFEMRAPHSLAQLDPGDIFAFFQGTVPTGYFHSSFPPRIVNPGP